MKYIMSGTKMKMKDGTEKAMTAKATEGTGENNGTYACGKAECAKVIARNLAARR